MIETEWFEGRSTDEQDVSWMRIVIEILCFACLGVLFAIALPGCSTTSLLAPPEVEKPFCAIQMLGQTPQGIAIVEMHCITAAEFEKAQK